MQIFHVLRGDLRLKLVFVRGFLNSPTILCLILKLFLLRGGADYTFLAQVSRRSCVSVRNHTKSSSFFGCEHVDSSKKRKLTMKKIILSVMTVWPRLLSCGVRTPSPGSDCNRACHCHPGRTYADTASGCHRYGCSAH